MPQEKRRIEIEDVRRALSDPLEICTRLGLEEGAKRQGGGGLMILCPWHAERTPSCSVTIGPDGTIRVKCFGCDQTGDVLDLVAAVENLDPRKDFVAVLEIAAELGGVGASDRPKRRPHSRPSHRVPHKEKPSLPAAVYAEMATALLARSPLDRDEGCIEYLRSRPRGDALVSEALLAGWGGLPYGRRAEAVVADLTNLFGSENLALAGFVHPERPSRFIFSDHRLLIPYRAAASGGRIETLQRRRLDGGHPKYVFPPSRPALSPYGAEALASAGRTASIVFVEGAPDVLDRRAKYRSKGLDRIVLGIPGIKNWRPEWAAFARGRIARVGVDTDEAGESVVETIVHDLWKAGASEVRRIRPSDGRKDWNS